MKILRISIGLCCLFFLGCPPANPYASITSNNSTFVTLSDKIETNYRYITDRNMRFKYHEDYNDVDMAYVIYNDRHQIVQTETDVAMLIAYGNNDCVLALGLNSGRYILEITNEKNVKKYLHFYLNVPYDSSAIDNKDPGDIFQ